MRRSLNFVIVVSIFICSIVNASTVSSTQGIITSADLSLERGNYFVEPFDLSKVGGDPRNYAMTKDSKGRLYVANNSGIFVFDGNEWGLIEGLTGLSIRSLAINDKRLYIGGRGIFGYIELNSVSGKSIGPYHSLKSLLPEEQNKVGVVKNTIIRTEGVYFRTNEAIYFYRQNGELEIITAQNSTFHRMFVVHDKLIMQKRRVGLYELNNGQVNNFVHGEFFHDKTVYALLEYQQSFLIFTADRGIYVYDGSNITAFEVEDSVKQLLQQNNIYLASWLSNGLIALAITGPQQGVMLIDAHGRLVRLVGGDDGLSDTLVNDMIEDQQGGLWLGLVNGLDRLEVGSSLTYFDSRHGLHGYFFSMVRYDSKLYVATSMGVFQLHQGDHQGDHQRAYFVQVKGISESCYSFLPTLQGLIIACDANLYRIKDGQPYHIHQSIYNIYSLLDVSKDQENPQILVGHNDRMGLLSFSEDNWHYQHLLDVASVTMAQDDKGIIWLRHQQQGVLRLEFDKGFTQAPKQHLFDDSFGLPSGKIYPSRLGDEVYFNSQHGLYRFEAGDSFANARFVAEEKYGNLSGRDVYLTESPSGVQYLIEQIPVHGVHSRSNARLAVVVDKDNKFELNFQDYTRVSAYPLLSIYAQSEEIIWVMSDDRLVRYASSGKLGEATSPFISRITTLHSEQQRLLNADQPVVLEFEDNSIRFDFAFTAFDEHQRNEFQYQLVGFDHHWSDWRSNKHKEYTQISEGKYSFALRAKDIYGRIASAKPIKVVILPPWYRTWWAYILYLVIFVSIVFVGTRIRTRALVERAQELENIIEERTKTIREGSLVIEQQKEAIESLLAQKNDLFANISHEFRTPLTLILGPTKSLLKGDLNSQQKNQLHLVRQSTFRLLRMVNQILTLAKLSAIPHQERVNLSIKEHVDFMISSFTPLAREKQITLKLDAVCDAKLFMVSDALEKILINLISNALKYTSEYGTVTIAVKVFKPGWVSIAVTDTGFGIPKEQLPRVFERFKRVNHPDHVKIQGTGLGLSMVKELVEAHGGIIYVDTEIGVGSTFTVELPQATQDAQGSSSSGLAQAQSSVDIELQAMEIQQAKNSSQATSAADELMVRSGDKLTILVVEDTDQMREFVVSLFSDEFVVFNAADGIQGIELAKKHLPDIIISDVMMPGKTGFEVCNELKTDELTSHIPIILLTAKNDMESRMQGWREQADEYLAKPFDEDELKLRVNNLLAIRKTLKQRFGRILHQQPEQIEQASNELTGKDQDFLKRFSQVIEQNYASSEFNLPMAASAMYASERLLQKKLKALMDHTFTEYLRTYRLNKAAQLLKVGKKASDAADECGFSSQAYFSRCFKAEFGQTATQYQQQNATV